MYIIKWRVDSDNLMSMMMMMMMMSEHVPMCMPNYAISSFEYNFEYNFLGIRSRKYSVYFYFSANNYMAQA